MIQDTPWMPARVPMSTTTATAADNATTQTGTSTTTFVTPAGLAYAAPFHTAPVVNARAMAQGLVFDSTAGAPLSLPAPGTADFSIAAWVDVTDLAAQRYIFGGATNSFGIRIHTDATLITIKVGVATTNTSTGTVPVGKFAMVAYVRAAGVGTFYLNASAIGSAADASDYSVGSTFLGSFGGSSPFFSGYLRAYVANRAWTAGDITARFESGGPLTDDYYGAGVNTAIAAGSFVVGKRYRISTAGTTDFTLIGAANSTVGTEFVATGVGTGTGAATALGLVFGPEANAAGAGPQHRDASGNAAHVNLPGDGITGGVTWAVPGGAACDFGETRTASGFSLGRDAVVIPPGYRIARIWCSGNGTFSIGNAASGTEIVNGFTATATTQPATLAAFVTTSRKLYLTLGTATTVTYTVHLERI